MDFKITNERKNDLFGRKEFEIHVESNSTPSRDELGKLISEKLSSPVERMVIKKIDSNFGSNTFLIKVFVYNSEDEKNKIEPKKKKVTQK